MTRARRAMTLRQRLDSKSVNQGDCRVWTASTDGKMGYGKLAWKGRMRYAHRLAYEDVHGVDVDGLVVRHTCDNPPCINVDHLILGTQADNVADCFARGRAHRPGGADHPEAALTAAQVADIRRRYQHGSRTNGQCALAREFGVKQVTIWRVVHRLSYKEMT